MEKYNGNQLIEDLMSNPEAFFKYGKSYDLLQEYFRGLDLQTLVPLLQSNDLRIQKPVIWIVSELAEQACGLLRYVVPLVLSDDKYIRYYALECITLCAKEEQIEYFVHLINSITDNDSSIKVLAMKLLSNAEVAQLRAGLRLVVEEKIGNYEIHQRGIDKLLAIDKIDEQGIIDMLNSSEALTQQYGVILALKRYKSYARPLEFALNSNNPDVRQFAQMITDMK